MAGGAKKFFSIGGTGTKTDDGIKVSAGRFTKGSRNMKPKLNIKSDITTIG